MKTSTDSKIEYEDKVKETIEVFILELSILYEKCIEGIEKRKSGSRNLENEIRELETFLSRMRKAKKPKDYNNENMVNNFSNRILPILVNEVHSLVDDNKKEYLKFLMTIDSDLRINVRRKVFSIYGDIKEDDKENNFIYNFFTEKIVNSRLKKLNNEIENGINELDLDIMYIYTLILNDILESKEFAMMIAEIAGTTSEIWKQRKTYIETTLENLKNYINERNLHFFIAQQKYISSILKTIRNHRYREDKDALNKLKEGIITYISDSEKINILTQYFDDQYSDYQKKLELEKMKVEPKQLEAIKSNVTEPVQKKDTPLKIVSQQNKPLYEYYTESDRQLIKEVSDIIFDNICDITLVHKKEAYIRSCLQNSNDEIIDLKLLEIESLEKCRKMLILIDMRNILDEIRNMYKFITTNQVPESESIKFIQEKKSKIISLQKLYDNYKRKYGNKSNKETELSDDSSKTKKNIIFFTTEMGNTCFMNGVKGHYEYYSAFMESLEELENGIFNSNDTGRDRKFSNNNILGIMREKKNTKEKTRVTYIIHKDIVLVINGFIKKETKLRKYETNIMSKDAQKVKEYMEQLKIWFEDPIKKTQIIDEHKKIYASILKELKENAQGKSKIKK